MSITFPKWIAREVHDWPALLIELPDGRTDINAATAAVINYMCAVGVPKLTENNANDAWCRIAIHQAVFGSFVENSSTGQPLFLTREDVCRHIGMETEGTEQSFLEFCGSIEWRAKREENERLPSYIANGGKSLLQHLGLTENDDNLTGSN